MEIVKVKGKSVLHDDVAAQEDINTVVHHNIRF